MSYSDSIISYFVSFKLLNNRILSANLNIEPMKKLLYLFTASLLVFTSCSKDDDNSYDSPSSILPKKITFTESDGTSYSEDIVYNGNKIVSVTEADGSQRKFTYNGNQIVKIEEFDKDGLSEGPTECDYTNGLMTSYVEKYDDLYNHKTKYIHNNDGTVSYEQFKINISTGVEEKYGQTGKLTFKDGNLIKAERAYDKSTSVEVYEYDTKNSPFKNVVGWNLILDDEPTTNNVIKRTYTSGSGGNLYTSETIYSYKYDANDYPIEKVATFPYGNSTSTETTQYAY
jgi:YD repeat-containing protein